MAKKFDIQTTHNIRFLANQAAFARKKMRQFENKADGWSNFTFYSGEFGAYRLAAKIVARHSNVI